MATFSIEIGYKVPLLVGLASLKWTFADDSVVLGVGAGFAIRDPLLRPATLVVRGLGAEGEVLAVEGDGSQQIGVGLLCSWWLDDTLEKGGFHFTFTTVKEEPVVVVVPVVVDEKGMPVVAEPAEHIGREDGLPAMEEGLPLSEAKGPTEAAGG